MIRAENRTGAKLDGSIELDTFIQFAIVGDSLTVSRIGKHARSIRDFAAMAKRLEVKGASLRVIEQPVVWSWPS